MRGLAVVVGLTCGPVLADDCATLWQQVESIGFGFDFIGTLEPTADGCVATDLRLEAQTDYGVDIAIDRLTLTTPDLAGFVSMTPTAGTLQLNVTGIRTVPVMPDPVMSYLYAAQAQAYPGYRLTVDFSFDVASDGFDLRQATADFGALGRVSLSVGLSGFFTYLSSPLDQLAPGLPADRFRLDVSATGLFESFLLIPLGTSVLTDTDPVSEMKGLKEQVLALIAQLPDELLDPDSRASLSVMVSELPNPRGQLVVEGTAAAGFLMLLSEFRLGQPVTVPWETVAAKITYTPIPDSAP